MSLTFIAGYRDRDVERLKFSLDSLKDQTCHDFDMMLVDYGSRSICSSKIRQIIADYPFCRYCYSDTRGWMWNRSAALNTGARLSEREFLFFTDVDIIYPRWFVERIQAHMAPDVFFASECFRCPQGFQDWDALRSGRCDHAWSSMQGKGLLCCGRRALETVGGLEEGFGWWGPEDIELVERLARLGLRDAELPNFYCYHQWHPRVIYELPLCVQFNNLVCYYASQAEARVRANERRGWGKLARFEDRPIYAYVDPEQEVPRPSVPVRRIEAFGVAALLPTMKEIATTKNILWAFPKYDASDRNAAFLNKVLRRAGWRLDCRLGYGGDVAQGLLLAVPGLFRDWYLAGTTGGQGCAFVLT